MRLRGGETYRDKWMRQQARRARAQEQTATAELLRTAADRITDLSRSRADTGTTQLVTDLRHAAADLSATEKEATP